MEKHHEIPLFAGSARNSVHFAIDSFALLLSVGIEPFMTIVFDVIFKSLLAAQKLIASIRPHLLFEAIELPTMLRPAAGKRTGQVAEPTNMYKNALDPRSR